MSKLYLELYNHIQHNSRKNRQNDIQSRVTAKSINAVTSLFNLFSMWDNNE